MVHRERFPLNVAGDFSVEDGVCMACTAPSIEAPDLMIHAENGLHCYFNRQPTTPEEIEQAVLAVVVSCCGGVRYAGTDPYVLRRLAEFGDSEKCDQNEVNAMSSEWDDDVRIGVPTANRGGVAAPHVRQRAPSPDPDIELREGETELGRPPQVPSGLALLSDADRTRLRQMEEEQASKELAEAEMLIASDPTGLGWLGWFGTPLVLAMLVGSVGLAGLFVFNQVLSVEEILASDLAA